MTSRSQFKGLILDNQRSQKAEIFVILIGFTWNSQSVPNFIELRDGHFPKMAGLARNGPVFFKAFSSQRRIFISKPRYEFLKNAMLPETSLLIRPRLPLFLLLAAALLSLAHAQICLLPLLFCLCLLSLFSLLERRQLLLVFLGLVAPNEGCNSSVWMN